MTNFLLIPTYLLFNLFLHTNTRPTKVSKRYNGLTKYHRLFKLELHYIKVIKIMTKIQSQFADYLVYVIFDDQLRDDDFIIKGKEYTLSEAELLICLYDDIYSEEVPNFINVKRSKAFVKELAKKMTEHYFACYV